MRPLERGALARPKKLPVSGRCEAVGTNGPSGEPERKSYACYCLAQSALQLSQEVAYNEHLQVYGIKSFRISTYRNMGRGASRVSPRRPLGESRRRNVK